MKNIRSAARSSAMSKLHKIGGHHGPHSSKMHKACGGGMKGYASGGAVNDQGGMGMVEGGSAKGRLDRPGRSMKGKHGKDKGKKGGTNVNVIVMPGGKGGDAGPMPPMMPHPPMAGGPPMPPGPMPPPHMAGPMPPPPMGGPPGAMPPMHKHGGKVKSFKRGGKVHKADGGGFEGMGKKVGTPEGQAAVRAADTVKSNMRRTINKMNDVDRASDALSEAKRKSLDDESDLYQDEIGNRKRGGKVMKHKKH